MQWEAGQHQSDYNSCRFAEDKLEYGKQWFRRYAPWINFDNPKNIADRIANCKLYDMNQSGRIRYALTGTCMKQVWKNLLLNLSTLHAAI